MKTTLNKKKSFSIQVGPNTLGIINDICKCCNISRALFIRLSLKFSLNNDEFIDMLKKYYVK